MLFPLLLGCGPSRQDLAVLAHTLEVDPFPEADRTFTNALTMAGEPPVDGPACTTAFSTDDEQEARALTAWVEENPVVSGRRSGARSSWSPLQAGRVTMARTYGRAAAQGSASHAVRWARMSSYLASPQVGDLGFDEQLAGAQALAELPLEPELVIVVLGASQVDTWLFDPTEKRMVCGGRLTAFTEAEAELVLRWAGPAPASPPDHASVAALTQLALHSLRVVPKAAVVAETPVAAPEAPTLQGAAAAPGSPEPATEPSAPELPAAQPAG